MSKLLTGYRAAMQAAHPLRLRDANREARLAVYKALIARWGAVRFGRHFTAIMAVMNRAYDEEAA